MTVQIEADENYVDVSVDGDIYQDCAECLQAMLYTQAKRGVKKIAVSFSHVYYINSHSQKCLNEMKYALESQGIAVDFRSTAV